MGPGFGFDKRAFDSFMGPGFSGLDKRSFDSLTARGFSGFDKRAFDSFVRFPTSYVPAYKNEHLGRNWILRL